MSFLKTLMKPPWSGQKVNIIVRVLAGVISLCATVAVPIALYYFVLEGVPADKLALVMFAFLGEVYLALVFGHVTLKGVAPTSWLPWK